MESAQYTPRKIRPTTPHTTHPSHHDFVDESMLKNAQPKTAHTINMNFILSREDSEFSGRSTTSPRRRGVMRSIPSVRPAEYFPALKFGVKFSSITLWDMRSVMTHSRPRPTSIRISRSVGATRIRRPLSRLFCPIHQLRASTIPTSSIVLPCRLLIIAIPIW